MSGAEVWVTIALVTLVTAALRGVGPMVLGGRELPVRLTGVIVLLPSALLAALVVTTALAGGGRFGLGATSYGVAAGVVLLLVRVPMLAAVVVAVAVTAGLRAVGVA